MTSYGTRPVAWSIAWAEAEEIDTLNILNARMLAMQRAMDGLSVSPGPGADRRQPLQRHHDPQRDGGEGRREKRVHCRRVHSGQGRQRSLYDRNGRTLPPVCL